ncbi:MAG: pyridoxal-dependent decarboxylase [Thermoguttaceae bacterium]|nr:pyridoxal-dependent decarboxylase [Thermoguttaceae bacterium]
MNSSQFDDMQIRPEFQNRMQEIRRLYFSRNAELWPIYKDPGLQHILAHTAAARTSEEQFEDYPDHERLLEEIDCGCDTIRTGRVPGTDSVDPLLLFSASLSKQWNNPASVENVVTMPSDPAIYGCMLAMMVNPNLVCTQYSLMANRLEKYMIRKIAKLAGYDPAKAGGVFTQGGTFCNMYGYLFGLRKARKISEAKGFDSLNNYRFICSQGGHYSNYTTLSVMGANIAEKNITIKIDSANRMDLADLERQLSACYLLGCQVPTIMLTMGTTDTFGLDRVREVYELVERLHGKYLAQRAAGHNDNPDDLLTRPHIHVDSAIGWALIFFLDYDFDRNPLCINDRTLTELRETTELFRDLKYADSFTVDFHKWGYVPYTASLVMVKDDASFKSLEHDPEYYSYFDRSEMVHTHLQSTIEASRGGGGIFGAYAALAYLGIEGFQTLIANSLQNACYFRERIDALPQAMLLTPYCHGPSVTFRLYDANQVHDKRMEWNRELHSCASDEDRLRIEKNTQFHRHAYESRTRTHLYTSWIEFAAHSQYDDEGKFIRIPGEKAVFFNPLTTYANIDAFMTELTNH